MPRPSKRSLSTRFAAAVRWLHIYVSLLAFAALVFFGITGITLNHPDWFGANAERVNEFEGTIDAKWLNDLSVADADAVAAGDETNSTEGIVADATAAGGVVQKLEIAEYLRATHRLKGAVSEFRVDDYECLVLFKGPGYSADVVIDRETARYTVRETLLGVVAVMNDLHKGRDTGSAWSVVIDVVSLVTVFVSLTGLLLIFYIRRKRMAGLLTTLAGTVLLVVLAIYFVP